MTDLSALLTIAAVFLVAGSVKGVIGLGLPTVSLGLLTAAFDLTTAMALLIVPSLLTNFWQACSGGRGRYLLRRLWPFLVTAAMSVWIGAVALSRVELSTLSALLGVLLILYGGTGIAGVRFRLTARQEVWAGPALGLCNGLLTGMTGSFVVPGVMYLQAIGLDRDALVQAMGMPFTISTLALALALNENNLMTGRLGMVSTAAVLPAVLGMTLGQCIRQRLPEDRFRMLFYAAILVLGAYIFAGAALSS